MNALLPGFAARKRSPQTGAMVLAVCAFLSGLPASAAPLAGTESARRAAQDAAQSQMQGEPIAVGLPYRWNMSAADFKAVSGTEHRVQALAAYPDESVVYQADNFVVQDTFLSQTAPRFHIHAYFKNDRLTEFTLIPNQETAGDFIGSKASWNAFLMLVVACQDEFGAAMKTQGSPLKAVRNVLITPEKGQKNEMPLGFQIQYRTWRARGANYRISHLFGGDMGLARMQGRTTDDPFVAPVTKNHTANRAEVASDVLENFYIAPLLAKAIMVNPRYFRAPDPAYWGRNIGVMDYHWNMTPDDVLNLPLGYTPVVVPSPKGRSLLLDKLRLDEDATLRWSLQLWFDKKGLSEFELRPFQETHDNNMHGVLNAQAFQDELNGYVRYVYGVPPKEWWETSRSIDTRKESRRIQTNWFTTPSETRQYTVLGNDNEYHYGSYYVPSSSYPVYRTYKQVEIIPVALPFVIQDRAWNQKMDKETLHFRQGVIGERTTGPEMGIVRLQGRRGGKPFYPGTGDTLKTKDAKPSRIIHEVYKNYNIPGAPKD